MPTRSWIVTRDELETRRLDLKAVNPNRKAAEDMRTPEELLDLIEVKGREIDAAIAELRASLGKGASPATDETPRSGT